MSHGRNTFSTALSSVTRISRKDAGELHDQISADLFKRGKDVHGASGDSYEEVKTKIVHSLGRPVVNGYGKKVLKAVLGTIVSMALPESVVTAVGSVMIFLIVKASVAAGIEFSATVDNMLNSVFGAIEKGLLATINSDW